MKQHVHGRYLFFFILLKSKISSIDLSLILDRHAYSTNSPPDYLLKNLHEQTSNTIPHGHQVNYSILSLYNVFFPDT